MSVIEDIIARAIAESMVYGGYDAETRERLTQHNMRMGHCYARTALTALEAEGYVVVPKEPTEAMFDAGLREMQYGIFAAYRAMIAAGKVET